VLKTIFYSLAALVHKILFSPLEDKSRIFVPLCNILYILVLSQGHTQCGGGGDLNDIQYLAKYFLYLARCDCPNQHGYPARYNTRCIPSIHLTDTALSVLIWVDTALRFMALYFVLTTSTCTYKVYCPFVYLTFICNLP
jgi:hypothetical protein